MEPYRVNLDVYNGPLDLLLYLIRRDEVDIYDIPISHITEQYVGYIDFLKDINPNLAGEFLVMAATLIEIKSRMLLPTAPVAEDGEPDDIGDPRAELVRQLLQYKAFKDAAGELQTAGEQASMRHPRKPVAPEFGAPEVEMDNIGLWDLLEAFNSLMASVGQHRGVHEVIYDDTPISLHAEDIVDRLRRGGNMTFTDIFAGRQSRSETLGLFLALLELIRQRRVTVQQDHKKAFSEIYIFLQDQVEPDAPFAESDGDPVIAAGAAMEGIYVSDRPAEDEDEQDDEED